MPNKSQNQKDERPGDSEVDRRRERGRTSGGARSQSDWVRWDFLQKIGSQIAVLVIACLLVISCEKRGREELASGSKKGIQDYTPKVESMFDYTKLKKVAHPYEEGRQIYSMTVSQQAISPFGQLPKNRSPIIRDKRDFTIFYIPSAEGEVDFDWLDENGPRTAKDLILWSEVALKDYKKMVSGNVVLGVVDDFDSRIRESIKTYDLEKELSLTTREILTLVGDSGIHPFLTVNRVVINREKNLYQVCCVSDLEEYFISYDFGMYKKEGKIEFAAPSFAVPEW